MDLESICWGFIALSALAAIIEFFTLRRLDWIIIELILIVIFLVVLIINEIKNKNKQGEEDGRNPESI